MMATGGIAGNGDKMSKTLLFTSCAQLCDRPTVAEVSFEARNGAHARRDRWSVVKRLRQAKTLLPHPPPSGVWSYDYEHA